MRGWIFSAVILALMGYVSYHLLMIQLERDKG